MFEGIDIDPELKEELLVNIRRRLTPQPIKFRADIDVTCFAYDGIDAVKEALAAGENCENEEESVKVSIFSFSSFFSRTHSFPVRLNWWLLRSML